MANEAPELHRALRRTRADRPCPGAWIDERGTAHFRVWAPSAKSVEAVSEDGSSLLTLTPTERGYFAASTGGLAPGALYMYRIDGRQPRPDPASRFQPQGPHGPSQLVEPHAYPWRDGTWRGAQMHGQVLYELHVGTFTPQGTLDAACERLRWLKHLGITMLELMPVAEFPGRWNWGYDGVNLYAPFHGYGDYEALKRFVDTAHETGLAVILDVVYNHLGPDGNYLREFSEHYYADRCTEWGDALNYDGKHCEGVRDFIVANAGYWVREFHFDGLRLDATQAIHDESPLHVIAEAVAHAREQAAPRRIVCIAEDETQRADHLLPIESGGRNLDAVWNDDFHHAARVALTGTRDGYFFDYRGRAQEFISAIRHGFLYQGQHYHWQQKTRGVAIRQTVPAHAWVQFLQNHDQVGNTFAGGRIHAFTPADRLRALTALLLLAPQTPLLFMGQEFNSSRRFPFFADHGGELGRAVWEGRRKFMSQFRAYADPQSQARVDDPAARETFDCAKLDWAEAARNGEVVRLYKDLLHLRSSDPCIAAQNRGGIDGATLSERCLVLRWKSDEHGDRLLVVNLDQELILTPAPEPLLAPPPGQRWIARWRSESPDYGGSGEGDPVDADQRWRIAANTATFLIATAAPPAQRSAAVP